MRINDFNATGFDSVIEPSLIAKMENGSNSATLVEKSITENGEYNASDDNADGYSSVTVNVPSGGAETFEVNISVDLVGDSGIVSDKTYSEMLAAYNANKKVIGTLTFITDLTEEYDIIGWDKNNLNGNNSLYIFTSVLGEGRQTQSIVLGFLETGYFIASASGEVIPNT